MTGETVGRAGPAPFDAPSAPARFRLVPPLLPVPPLPSSSISLLRDIVAPFEAKLRAPFVDEAQLPLVVDPLIGSSFETYSPATSYVDTKPDVAYDASNDVYLAVFERVFSALDHDVHAQNFRAK